MDAIRVALLGRGRPRTRPERVIADQGDSHPQCRMFLQRRCIRHTIPTRRDQRARTFDQGIYRRRNVVERCVNRLKQWRGMTMRSEKRTANDHAMATIACFMIWLAS